MIDRTYFLAPPSSERGHRDPEAEDATGKTRNILEQLVFRWVLRGVLERRRQRLECSCRSLSSILRDTLEELFLGLRQDLLFLSQESLNIGLQEDRTVGLTEASEEDGKEHTNQEGEAEEVGGEGDGGGAAVDRLVHRKGNRKPHLARRQL